MIKRKTKPATAGERIAKYTHVWHPSAFKTPLLDREIARRIDAAIRRAVKKERDRCALVAFDIGDDLIVAKINGGYNP